MLLAASAVRAQHFDVELRTSGGPVAGSRITTAFFGDAVISGQLPVDAVTGYKIFPGYLGDLEGGPFLTDDPGFQAFANTFLRREQIHFRALGTLHYWNPATGRWGPAAGHVELALFGGIPVDVILGYTDNPVVWRAQYDYYAAGTRYTTQGIQGPPTALIDDASASGAFHAHLDWRISAMGGEPPAGAYMVALELWSTAVANGQAKYLPSEPIHIVFERGISEAQLQSAFQARINPPQPAACASATLSWQVADRACSADVSSVDSGSSAVALDVTQPLRGSAHFSCEDGLWSSASEAICDAVPLGACPAQTQTWAVGGQTCGSATAAVASGLSAIARDSAAPTLGSAIFTCSDGMWSSPSAASCAMPSTQTCAAQPLVWSVDGVACQAPVLAAPAGVLARALDTLGPARGSASFQCVNGNWQQQAQPAAQCGALTRTLTRSRPRAPWSPPQALPWQGP